MVCTFYKSTIIVKLVKFHDFCKIFAEQEYRNQFQKPISSVVTKVYSLMKRKIERHQYEKRISCGKRGMRPTELWQLIDGYVASKVFDYFVSNCFLLTKFYISKLRLYQRPSQQIFL